MTAIKRAIHIRCCSGFQVEISANHILGYHISGTILRLRLCRKWHTIPSPPLDFSQEKFVQSFEFSQPLIRWLKRSSVRITSAKSFLTCAGGNDRRSDVNEGSFHFRMSVASSASFLVASLLPSLDVVLFVTFIMLFVLLVRHS